MKKRLCLLLVATGAIPLGGCVAGMAASAVGAAVNASRPAPTNQDLRQPAVAACTARAAQYGEVHVIDAQQSGGRVRVWGTVSQAAQRQAFKCDWRRQVADFDLSPLPPLRPTG